jgi:hypothetical protein
MKTKKKTEVSTSDLLPVSVRSPESQTVAEVERVRSYPDRRCKCGGVMSRGYFFDHLMVCEICDRVELAPESNDEGGASPGNR